MQTRTAVTLALALCLASAAVVATLVGAQSNAQPADKMAVSGSAVAVSGPGTEVTLLAGAMKTSSPEDVVVTVSLECDILTTVTTTGNDDARAFGEVKVWVELDGVPIAVSSDDTGADAGQVVFCNRAHQQTTSLFDDQDATISSYLQTRSANSFQWISLNLGAGDHTFVVKSTLTQTATNNAVAQAAVGKRTLTVDPVKLANNAAI